MPRVRLLTDGGYLFTDVTGAIVSARINEFGTAIVTSYEMENAGWELYRAKIEPRYEWYFYSFEYELLEEGE